MLFSLQFPEIDLNIKIVQNQPKVKCLIRNKWLVCTPEEWVRQHFILYLIHQRNYPQSSIAVEKMLLVNGIKKRFDILIYDSNFNIQVLIECKKETVPLQPKTWSQTLAYNSVLNSAFIVITNGKQAMCCKTEPELQFLKEVPLYEGK
jgi:hypothetical protein